MSEVDFKLCDLLDLSKICAPEYNMPELSDRVLVFDVMKDGWETTAVLTSSSASNIINHLKPSNLTDEETMGTEETTLSESETKPDTGSASDEESKADGAEISSTETIYDNNDDNAISSTSENVAEKSVGLFRQHKIFVHSFWLAVQSKYFRSLFYSGMKESHCNEIHMKITESEEKAHLTLVEAMYKADVLNDASVDELLAVLELADKYDLKFVFKKCKYVLQKHAITFEISKKIMRVIKVKHRMEDAEDLAATLQKVLANEFSPLDNNWQRESFTSLTEPSVRYLLSSDDLVTQSENTVFHALMHWMEENEVQPSSLEPTSKLLAAVLFELVTIDFLYNVIKNHPIASKMPLFKDLYLNGVTYNALPLKQKKLLKKKPVERKESKDNIVQYTFTVQQADFQKALNNPSELKSEVFWCCGYKMRMGFTKYSSNYLKPCLNILELNSESFLSLEWFPRKKGHESCYLSSHSFTFASSCVSYDSSSFQSNDFNNSVLDIEVIVKPKQFNF